MQDKATKSFGCLGSSWFRQVHAILYKNSILALNSLIKYFISSLLFPIILYIVLGYSKSLFLTKQYYGIGESIPILPISQTNVLDRTFIWVDFENSTISNQILNKLVNNLDLRQKNNLRILDSNEFPNFLALTRTYSVLCPQNFMGKSDCTGAVEIYNTTNTFNYTIRGPVRSNNIDVKYRKSEMDQNILPIQWELDSIYYSIMANKPIVTLNQMSLTNWTQSQYEYQLRLGYVKAFPSFLSLVFLVGFLPMMYPLMNSQTSEREQGLTALLFSMGAKNSARYVANYIFYVMLYGIGWIATGLVSSFLIFNELKGPVIFYHIIFGLSFVSWGLFFSTFFKKSLLSGLIAIVINIVLAIVVILTGMKSPVAATILSLIFPSVHFILAYNLFSNSISEYITLNWLKTSKDSSISLIVIVIVIFVQIIILPFITVFLESRFYGLRSKKQRHIPDCKPEKIIRIENLNKSYSMWPKKNKVHAVRNLNLTIPFNAITCLLGQNGCGKSTTIDILAKKTKPDNGQIIVDGTLLSNLEPGIISICPQKDLLWDQLTVLQHIKIFCLLKTCHDLDYSNIDNLVKYCDLVGKEHFKANKLSGGQKRKLQMALAFAGGPPICLMDEVTSALDPISRRRIWEIIQAYKEKKRTILFCTHYLDEAESLADYICIMNQGRNVLSGNLMDVIQNSEYILMLRGEGALELANHLSMGFNQILDNQIEISLGTDKSRIIEILHYVDQLIQTKYQSIKYDLKGPSLEDTFLSTIPEIDEPEFDNEFELTNGRPLSLWSQTRIIFLKRIVLLKTQYFSLLITYFCAIFFTGIAIYFLGDYTNNCNIIPVIPVKDSFQFPINTDLSKYYNSFLFGPDINQLRNQNFSYVDWPRQQLLNGVFNFSSNGNFTNTTYVTTVSSAADLHKLSIDSRNTLTQGGLYCTNETSMMTWIADAETNVAPGILNLYSNLELAKESNSRIQAAYQPFAYPVFSQFGNALKFMTFMGLALLLFPVFAVIQPAREIQNNVKKIYVANGVRPLAIYLAHFLFDLINIIIITLLIYAILSSKSFVAFNLPGLIIPFVFLYGCCATVLGYLVTRKARSVVMAFGIAAIFNYLSYIITVIAIMQIVTVVNPPSKAFTVLRSALFVIALFNPIVSIYKFFAFQVNLFSLACENSQLPNDWMKLSLYGGSLLYIIVQLVIYTLLLMYFESDHLRAKYQKKIKNLRSTENYTSAKDNEWELTQDAYKSDDFEKTLIPIPKSYILKADSVTKSFSKQVKQMFKIFYMMRRKNTGRFIAVDNVSMAFDSKECICLLGPNGAGKSTMFGMLEGTIIPDNGRVLIHGIDVHAERSKSRQFIGLCPQYNAFENLSVYEHCKFYALIKGIPSSVVESNARAVISQVGLQQYYDKKAETLSGGNQRKLTLAIALIGNPDVILVDEASTGVDIAAKRHIWKTLKNFTKKHLIIVSTHSMEEADALATKILMLDKRIITMGTISQLRERYCPEYFIKIAKKDFESNELDSEIDEFIKDRFPNSKRYSAMNSTHKLTYKIPVGGNTSVSTIFSVVQEAVDHFDLASYSVSQANLEDLFLAIV